MIQFFQKRKINTFTVFLLLCFSTIMHAQDSLNMTLIYHWDDATVIANTTSIANRYNEVWGFVQNNREYAVIGSTKGTHIIDVTNDENIFEAAFIEGTNSANNIIHRDYHDYNGYLYAVADEGADISLQIMDISNLPDTVTVPVNGLDLGGDNTILRSHNIFIDTATARMYSANFKLKVYTLANPLQPELIQSLSFPQGVHDMYVENDTAYVNDGYSGLYVYDLTDIDSVLQIGELTNYPTSGYNHAGWLNSKTRQYIMADETHGSPLKLLDVSNLQNIEIMSMFSSEVDSAYSIAHNPIIKEELVYSSYYHDGVYVFDVSDPFNPIIKGFYDTSLEPNANNFKGCWGVYPFLPSGKILASDMENGLFVLRLEDESSSTNHVTVNEEIKIEQLGRFLQIMSNDYDDKELNIYDLSGKKLETRVYAKSTIFDISALPQGAYVVEAKSSTIRTVQKIIKSW